MSESLIGLSATITELVEEKMLANRIGSGTVAVFATPELILLLEKTAVACLEGHLEAGQTTVGSNLEVNHLAATPLGMQVTATVEVLEVDRRKVTFKVTARDETDQIAEGRHTRFIVDAERFQSAANLKLTSK